jgi:hypothetical protein
MLQNLSWLIPASAGSLAIATSCAIASFWIIERLVTDYRLSKVEGVRASILAGNPITCKKTLHCHDFFLVHDIDLWVSILLLLQRRLHALTEPTDGVLL